MDEMLLYPQTLELRGILDANGVEWMDVWRPGMRRTCFMLDINSQIYWYADDRGGNEPLVLYMMGWPEKCAKALGLKRVEP